MTLASLALGVPARIASIDGLSEEEALRLSALGLCPGAQVTKILPTPLRDPVECLVEGQLIAISSALMALILVEAVG
jgi:Fe2+ transport system protein FeoA